MASSLQGIEVVTPTLKSALLSLAFMCAPATGADTPAPASAPELVAQALQYEHAEGVARDFNQVASLYCAAARMGDADGQFGLAWMYANGRGVAKDDAVAAHLFALAAAQGHRHAANMMQFAKVTAEPLLPACLKPTPPPVIAAVEEIAVELPYPKGRIYQLVQKLAPRYAIDPHLALAVIWVESGFNVTARSPKNAQGLMQLIPETAQRFQVRNVLDAEDNIKGGLAYLRWLLAFFQGDVELVAAAYNSGERTVEKYRGIPPYPETQAYVRKITALYKKSSHPYQSDLVQPAPMTSLSSNK